MADLIEYMHQRDNKKDLCAYRLAIVVLQGLKVV
jgi:hypothetical protein